MNKATDKPFIWHGINHKGLRVSGQQQAPNVNTVKINLIKHGITPLKIKRQTKHIISRRNQKISNKAIADFTSQLAMLLQTHIPLSEALQIIAEGYKPSALKTMVLSLKKQLESGNTFSNALQQFPKHFNTIYCGLTHAGEQSGTLTTLLSELADYQKRMLTLKNKVAKALFYPIIVLVIAVCITTGLLVFVVPQFQNVFANFGAKLPWFTQCVIKLSDLVQQYGLTMLVSLFAVVLSFRFLLARSLSFKRNLDVFLLKLPLIGNIIKTATLARLLRILATTTRSGIPLIDALTLANKSMTHYRYKQAMNNIISEVSAGTALNQAMNNSRLFPARAIQMIAIGEQSGSLDIMLEEIAKLYQTLLDNILDYLSKLLEPAIMMILAVLTGGLVIAMYLPIFKMGAVI